jgi:hypothetical protein
MPELSLAALIKSRGALKARLTKFVSMVDELNQENPNFDQLKMKFEKFKSLESEFDSVQKQIESHVEEDAVDEQVAKSSKTILSQRRFASTKFWTPRNRKRQTEALIIRIYRLRIRTSYR